MLNVVLEGLAPHTEEGTIQAWFMEEGDVVEEGDNLVEISTSDGILTLQAPKSGILAEVYFDEGETVSKGEILCSIDDEETLAEDNSEKEERK